MDDVILEQRKTLALEKLLERYRKVVKIVKEWETLPMNCAMERVFEEGFVDPFAVDVAYDEIYRMYETIGGSKGKTLHEVLFQGAALMFTVRKMVVK